MGVFNLGHLCSRAVYTPAICISTYGAAAAKEGVCFVARFSCSDLPYGWRKACNYFLAFAWFSGLICGTLVSLQTRNSLSALMRSALSAPVSIVGLLCVTVLPFLFSAFAVFLSKPILLLPICFAKAFVFAFCSTCILQAFGSAGWLIRWLLLFGDCASIPLLYWFWMRYLPGKRHLFCLESVWVFSLSFLTAGISYRVISPLLLRLIF